MSARVHIIQRAILRIRIPIQRQRISNIPQITIFLEESSLIRIIIPGPQILKPCIRVIALRIISIEFRMLCASQCHFPIGVVLVHIRQHTVMPGVPGDASPAIVQVIAHLVMGDVPCLDPIVIPRHSSVSIRISFCRRTVDRISLQYLRVLLGGVVHILD